MNLSKSELIILVAAILSACTTNPPEHQVLVAPSTSHIIYVDGLKKVLAHDSIVLIDIRKSEEYQLGHLPGAINIYRPDIQNDSLPYSGMMTSKIKMEKLFSDKGIGNDDYLVLYDDNGSCDAARLWWVLDYYGFQKTALLDGGIKQWIKNDSLSQDPPKRSKTQFTFPNNMVTDRHISLEELNSASADSSLVIIDSRTPEEYSGGHLKNGAFDQGRIPGSVNIDWTEAINYDAGTFKNKDEIKAIYAAKGIDSTTNVVVYCHSGVRSSHTTFVLTELLGYKNVKNYDGSWIEWSYHKMPLERSETAQVIN